MGSVPKMESVEVKTVLENLKSYFQRRLPSSAENVILRVKSEDAIVTTSATLLTWVLENLIKNAIDSIDKESGEVTLRSEIMDMEVSITVNDNGSGIVRRDWKNVFRPGYTTKERLSLIHI